MSDTLASAPGPVAQLGARLVRIEEVAGSNPARSMREPSLRRGLFFFSDDVQRATGRSTSRALASIDRPAGHDRRGRIGFARLTSECRRGTRRRCPLPRCSATEVDGVASADPRAASATTVANSVSRSWVGRAAKPGRAASRAIAHSRPVPPRRLAHCAARGIGIRAADHEGLGHTRSPRSNDVELRGRGHVPASCARQRLAAVADMPQSTCTCGVSGLHGID